VNFSQRFFAGGVIDKAALKAAEMAARVESSASPGSFSRSNCSRPLAPAARHVHCAKSSSKTGCRRAGLPRRLALLRSQMIKAGISTRCNSPVCVATASVIAGGFAIMAGLFAELGIEQMDVAETPCVKASSTTCWDASTSRTCARRRWTNSCAAITSTPAGSAHQTRALKLLAAYGASGENDERFLDWAARLHEIGLSVSHGGFHRHSGYILENADMPGFSRTDQARLALLARAQRGALLKLPALLLTRRPCPTTTACWCGCCARPSSSAAAVPNLTCRRASGSQRQTLPPKLA